MRPGNPPPRKRGSLSVTTRERVPRGHGANRANRANPANPPTSDLAPAREVTFQVTYGVRWGANLLCLCLCLCSPFADGGGLPAPPVSSLTVYTDLCTHALLVQLVMV